MAVFLVYMYLNYSTLYNIYHYLGNFADDKLMIFFLFFQEKKALTFYASCLLSVKCHA